MRQTDRSSRRVAPGKSTARCASLETLERLERRICLDATPPTVTAAEFIFDAFPVRQTIAITFSENVEASLEEEDLTIANLTTTAIVQTNEFGLDFDEATNTARITFDGNFPFHVLPDGNYRVTLPAGSVEDAAGNELEQDFTFDFFFLNGDANRDRRVDLLDFNILASNFGREPRTFTQADFDYDGKVRLEDFNILAARFGTVLAPPAASAAAGGTSQLLPFGSADEQHDQLSELA
jgi:hypothetical protein